MRFSPISSATATRRIGRDAGTHPAFEPLCSHCPPAKQRPRPSPSSLLKGQRYDQWPKRGCVPSFTPVCLPQPLFFLLERDLVSSRSHLRTCTSCHHISLCPAAPPTLCVSPHPQPCKCLPPSRCPQLLPGPCVCPYPHPCPHPALCFPPPIPPLALCVSPCPALCGWRGTRWARIRCRWFSGYSAHRRLRWAWWQCRPQGLKPLFSAWLPSASPSRGETWALRWSSDLRSAVAGLWARGAHAVKGPRGWKWEDNLETLCRSQSVRGPWLEVDPLGPPGLDPDKDGPWLLPRSPAGPQIAFPTS